MAQRPITLLLAASVAMLIATASPAHAATLGPFDVQCAAEGGSLSVVRSDFERYRGELHGRVKAVEALCNRGAADGCYASAVIHECALGVPRDPKRASKLYARAARIYRRRCDKGDSASCSALGELLSRGRGVPRNRAQAIALLERGCTKKKAAACRVAGSFHTRSLMDDFASTDAGRDPKRGDALLLRGCKLGDAVACSLVDGMERRACKLGTPALCLSVVEDLQSDRAIEPIFKLACRKRFGAEGCYQYAQKEVLVCKAAECFEIDARHWPWARRRLRQLCTSGQGEGCLWLAEALSRIGAEPAQSRGLFEEAARELSKACAAGDFEACHLHADACGNLEPTRASACAPRVLGRSASSLKSRCRAGDGQTCYRIGLDAKGPQKKSALERGCRLGYRDACRALQRERGKKPTERE